jgi:hypothetical protein
VTTTFHGDSDAGSPDVFVYEHGFTCYYSGSAVLIYTKVDGIENRPFAKREPLESFHRIQKAVTKTP